MKRTPPDLRPWLAGLVLAAVSAASPAQADYPAALTALDPVAYWPLNETVPSPALNTVATLTPLGAAGTGYFVKSLDQIDASKGEPGIVGNSVRFYNAGNVIGYSGSKIDIPHTAALNPEAPFTVEFWAKPNALGADAFCPLANLNSYFTSANRSGWIFYANGPTGRWQFRVGGENSYTASPQSAAGTAAAGRWSHVVGVFDGAEARLYVDGALAATAPASASAPFQVNNWVSLRIGSTALAGSDGVTTWNHPYGNRQFDGWVDEVAIYNSALSADRIASHYTAGTTNPETYGGLVLADQPLGYWNLDEPAFTDPAPSTYPLAVNAGSAGAVANGTNTYGVLAAQPGVPYTGFPAANKSVFFSGLNGNLAVGDPATPPAELDLAGEITLAAWVRPLQRDWYRQILVHGNWATGAATFLRIGTGDGAIDSTYYEVGASDGGPDVTAYFPVPEGDLGNWVHLVGTYDGGNWNLYRNGLLVASTADTVGAVPVSDFNWSLGADTEPNPGAALAFGGWIDEPAIFAKALTEAEVAALYRAANVPPVITRAPQAPTAAVYEGSTLTLDVWAEGSPALTYQWTRNGAPLPGQTATNLTLTKLTAASSGTYGVVVTNPYGSATRTIDLTVLASAPIITGQPASVTRWSGQPFKFSVAAFGTEPIAYQWKREAAPIANATTAEYSAIASAAVAGNYTVSLSNPVGAVDSAAATLTVLPVPAGYVAAIIEDLPLAYYRLGEASGTVAHDYAGGLDGQYHAATLGRPGYAAVDSDTAAGFTGTGSYVGGIDGTAINFSGTGTLGFAVEAWANGPASQVEGATIVAKGTGGLGGSANEQFALDISLGGNFRFFVRNPAGDAFEAEAPTGPDGAWHHLVGVYDGASELITLYVDGEPVATAATPATGVRTSSFEVSIGSRRSGVAPEFDLTFNGTVDEVAIYGSALTAERVLAHHGAAYGLNMAPFITVQPVPTANYVGLPATLRVKAAGSMPLTYQWRKNGNDLPGATASSLQIASLVPGDAGAYTVRIQNNVSSLTSEPATLTVLSPPTTPPVIPGLVLRLPFDNTLTDATGHGNNGTKVGNPSFVGDGAVGSALHYSTDESGTNYVTLGVRPGLNFSSNVSFSVAFWIRLPVNYTGGDLPFFTDATNSTFNKGFVFAPSYGFDATANPATDTHIDGAWAFSVLDGAAAGVGGHGPIGSINDGNWHHLLYVLDRSEGSVTYLDGVPSAFTRQEGTTFGAAGDISTGAPATIGQDPAGQYGEFGSADIDELGVWRRPLTPLEAASVYVAGVAKLGFEDGEVTLDLEVTADKQLKLSWPAGTLQSADSISGSFTDVTTVSPYLVAPTAQQRFYRVKL